MFVSGIGLVMNICLWANCIGVGCCGFDCLLQTEITSLVADVMGIAKDFENGIWNLGFQIEINTNQVCRWKTILGRWYENDK